MNPVLNAIIQAQFLTRPDLDTLARRHTAAASFAELVGEPDPEKSPYRPTLRCMRVIMPAGQLLEVIALADAYDAVMLAVGSPKRAFRGLPRVDLATPFDEDQVVELTPKGLAATVEG